MPVSGLNLVIFSALARLRALPSSREITAAPIWLPSSRVSCPQMYRFSLYSLSGYARGRQPGGVSLLYCFSVAGVDIVLDDNIVNYK